MTVNVQKGNGIRRIILAKASSSVNSAPIDGTPYTANQTFGSGTQLGTGNYVVYSDTGSAFTLSGLTANTTYYFSVFEYNGASGFANFLTSSFLTGSQITTNNIYYFSKSTGNLNALATWGTNIDGSGTSPVSFTTPNSYYYIFNNPAPTLNGNLNITGGNTALVVGDGVNSYNLTIPAGFSVVTDTLVVKKNSTVTVYGSLIGTTNIFEDTTTAQFLSSSSQNIPTASYYNLVTNSSTKTLNNGNVIVRNTLTMLSSVNLNNYILLLGNSASSTGTLNAVSGTLYGGTFMRWFNTVTNSGSSGLFPIGTSTSYRPVQINYTTAPTAAGTLAATFISTQPNNTGLPLLDFNTSPVITINKVGKNGTWVLTPGTLAGGSFTASFTAAGFYGVTSYADLRLVRRNNSSSAWSLTGTAQVTTGSNAVPVLSRIGMNAFGEFGVGGDSGVNALPVKLIILSVEQNKNNEAMLSWQTASEINSDHFEILRSTNNVDWHPIAKITAAGNSSDINNYRYNDDISGLVMKEVKTIYYQLKQADKDGSIVYSNVITVNIKTVTNTITLYPLPINNILKAVSNNGETISEIILLDMSGKEMLKTSTGQLDVTSLADGMYLAKVTTDKQVYYQKITK